MGANIFRILTKTLVFLALFNILFAQCFSAESYLSERTGLQNSSLEFHTSLHTKRFKSIAYIGGPLSREVNSGEFGKPRNAQIHNSIQECFPGAPIGILDMPTGVHGSWLGAFYIPQIMATHPALIVIEFIAGAGPQDEESILSSTEGMVRQIWKENSTADILFLYTMSERELESYLAGQPPLPFVLRERVAEHYGIPSFNLTLLAAKKLTSEGPKSEESVRSVYREAFKSIFRDEPVPSISGNLVSHPLSPKLSAAPLEKAQLIPYELVKLEGNWRVGQKSPVSQFLHVAVSDQHSAEMTVRFKGDRCGIYDVTGPETGNLEISIDDSKWVEISNWDLTCKIGNRADIRMIAEDLDGSLWHEVKIRPAANEPVGSQGKNFYPASFLINGEVQNPFADLDPLARLDAVWASIRKPFKIQFEPDRWKNIPNSVNRLQNGSELKIVMLGDSIIGDTAASNFELLLERMFSGCKIKKIISVKGGAGCWYFKEPDKIKEFVLKYQPDLLIIGGISQKEDIESIRAVIRQVRERLPKCEVLLLTPVFGAVNQMYIKNWSYDIDTLGSNYRSRLRQLAGEENCAFFDMTGPWWQFIKDSGSDYGYFQRDEVHANERGQQLLGRLIEKYFEP